MNTGPGAHEHEGVHPAAPHPEWPYGQPQPAEYWLDPGAAMPLRSWQRRTRHGVIVVSLIGALLLAGIVAGALLLGLLKSTHFTARGGVVADCATETAQAPDGELRLGAPVRIFAEAGGEVAQTTLDGFLRADECRLTFEVTRVSSSGANYVVQIGDSLTQTVSETALREGAVLRP